MYRLNDILEEIYILQIDWNIANTTRQKILIDNKIKIKKELFEIMKNKVHYYVV